MRSTAWPPDALWVAGDDGMVARWNGSAWQALASGTTHHLRALYGVGADDVWVGGEGTLLHWNGSAFVDHSAALTLCNVLDLDGRGPNDVWATCNRARVLHWDGSAWHETNLVDAAQLAAGTDIRRVLARPGATWFLSAKGEVVRALGGAWTKVTTRAGLVGMELTETAAGVDLWGVSDKAELLHYADGAPGPNGAGGTNGQWVATSLGTAWFGLFRRGADTLVFGSEGVARVVPN